ncbi:MAG: ATP-binding protein [Pseudomonadota bacterium]
MSDEIERYKARYKREKASRKEAEQLLEDKSRELFKLNSSLKELTETLERKVEDRTADLAQARDEAIRLSRVKSDFLANMSHELRTPMNGVLGMLNLLKESDLSPRGQKLVSTASHSGELLLKIINDILDFTKLEADKLEIENVAFTPIELLESVTQPFFTQAQHKRIELITVFPPSLPSTLTGDPTRIQQVISNIISNAIKFTDFGEVVVKAFYQKNRLHVNVTDTGVGIEEHQVDKIFSAFSQADESTTRKFGGTGLGLSICHHLVKLMGGNIEVKSEINQGSTFSVSLPLVSECSSKHFDDSLTCLSNTVVIAAKHPLNQQMLSSLITSWRLGSAEIFGDSEALLTRLEDDDIDLMLIEESIFEDCELLKSFLKEFCNFEVIVLTQNGIANSTLTDFIQLSLPYKQSELYNTIAPIFGLNAISISSKSAFDKIKFKGQHLLLVEDNATNQEVAKEILKLVNLNVTIAENGQQGMDLVKTDRFSLVLMDIQMPVMDGLTATQTIRQLGDKYTELPIIAMTAHSLKGDREKSLDAGMNNHVTKPIDPNILFGVLADYLDYDEINEDRTTENADNNSDNSATAEEHDVPELDGVDIEAALKRMSGNWPLLKKILLMYKKQQCSFVEDFQQEQRQQNPDELVRLTHTLKGSSANVGADKVSAIAKDLETHLKSEIAKASDISQAITSTKIDLLLQQLSEELEVTTNSIASLERE